ncbi:hypothetical protein FH972_021005 [Carpinus fangiana]|uniref:Uncharacterized protein n=1 Tax=Carpinus fangiana TaxID=176857 RepID=A0A5N6KNN2_9ROSI|nr:hypothetical protein FH972_021005 [Carpinus fangiana]
MLKEEAAGPFLAGAQLGYADVVLVSVLQFYRRRTGVDGGVVEGGRGEVDGGEHEAHDQGVGAPAGTAGAGKLLRSRETQADHVKQVWGEERRQSEDKVGGGLVGVAERAVRQDVRAILEIEEAAVSRCKLCAEGFVEGGQRPDRGHTSEDDIGCCLDASVCKGKHIRRRVEGEGCDESEGRKGKEDIERS